MEFLSPTSFCKKIFKTLFNASDGLLFYRIIAMLLVCEKSILGFVRSSGQMCTLHQNLLFFFEYWLGTILGPPLGTKLASGKNYPTVASLRRSMICLLLRSLVPPAISLP